MKKIDICFLDTLEENNKNFSEISKKLEELNTLFRLSLKNKVFSDYKDINKKIQNNIDFIDDCIYKNNHTINEFKRYIANNHFYNLIMKISTLFFILKNDINQDYAEKTLKESGLIYLFDNAAFYQDIFCLLLKGNFENIEEISNFILEDELPF